MLFCYVTLQHKVIDIVTEKISSLPTLKQEDVIELAIKSSLIRISTDKSSRGSFDSDLCWIQTNIKEKKELVPHAEFFRHALINSGQRKLTRAMFNN